MWLHGENGLIRLSHILSNDCTDIWFHQRLALPRKISNYSNQKKLWFRGLGSRLSRIASLQNINGSCRHTSITSSSHVFKLAAVPAAEHANPVFLALLVTAQTLVWYGHCSDCSEPLSRDCSNVHQRQRSAYKARRCWQPLPKSDRARLADCWTPHTLAETKKDHDKKTAYCSTDTKKEVCMYWGPVFTPIC